MFISPRVSKIYIFFGLEVANLYEGYSNILTMSFDEHQPILSGFCERLKKSFVKMGHYLDNHPDDPYRPEVFRYSQLNI